MKTPEQPNLGSRLRKLWRLFNRREKVKTVGLFFLMVVAAMMEMVGIGAIPAFILVVASPDKLFLHPVSGPVLEWLGIENSRELLVVGSVGLIGFFVLKGLLSVLIDYVRIRFVQHKFKILSRRLFFLYMFAPYSFHLNRNSSELLRNVNHESQVVIQNVFMPLMGLALSGVSMVFIFVLLLVVEPVFSLVAVAALGSASWLFLRLIRKKTDYYGRDVVEQRKVSNKVVLQGIAGLKDVRVLGRENSFLEQYAESLDRRSDAQFFRNMINNLQRPVFETITVIGVLGLALVLTARNESIESIIAVLALFAAATYRLMPTFRDLMNHLTELRYSLYSIDPVFRDLEDLKGMVREGPDKDFAPLPFEHEIVIKDVQYVYPNSSDQALYDVSLTIPRGRAVALVGESGAGKTTLVDALLGLLEIQGGSIRVDGADALENPRAWRRNIGYIPQFVYLMDDTLLRNVAMGLKDEEIDMARFSQAVEAARLRELIDHLPDREHTVLGERGVRLSGGQRQRVGIARALYHDPQLLIMDEGTSALDNITERFIIEAIDRLKGDRTVILIAHRLTTVMKCDVIYFMEGGRIKDHGTYAELLQRNARFREMAGTGEDS